MKAALVEGRSTVKHGLRSRHARDAPAVETGEVIDLAGENEDDEGDDDELPPLVDDTEVNKEVGMMASAMYKAV